jgi:hypothetical protein
VLVGKCAARQTGSSAAEYHRHPARVADAQNRAYLLLVFGQRHQERHALVGGEAVALEGLEIFVLMQQRVGREDHGKLPDQFGLGDPWLQRFGRKQIGLAHAGSAKFTTRALAGAATKRDIAVETGVHIFCSRNHRIKIARKSLTLVSVGPVMTRSPSPEKKL